MPVIATYDQERLYKKRGIPSFLVSYSKAALNKALTMRDKHRIEIDRFLEVSVAFDDYVKAAARLFDVINAYKAQKQ